MFSVISGDGRQGFYLKFENGWTVSVQFGYGSYCSNRDNQNPPQKSDTAEIAAWDSNDVWYKFDGDEVKGYVTPDEVAEFLHDVSSFHPDANVVNAVREVHEE